MAPLGLLILLGIAALFVVFVMKSVLSAHLSLAAQPRLAPAHSRLPPGPCSVELLDSPGQLIKAIKELRELTGWNLRQTKAAFEGQHVVLGVTLESAEAVVRLIEEFGGRARIVELGPREDRVIERPQQGVAIQSKPTASSRCPYCHGVAGEDGEPVVACTACLARHHEACWDEHRQCAGCGGTERYTGVEQTEGRQRDRRAKDAKEPG